MYRYSVDKKTKGKLIRKHTVPQQGYNNETMHLILADDKGDRVEAVVEEYLIGKFNETLIEGNSYAINGFSLAEKSHSFYPANNPYKMLFHDTTTLHRLNDNECSGSMFCFTNFADIKDGSHVSDSILFDVIAEVIDIKIMPVTAECNRSVHLLLRDEEKNTMQCMLWDSYFIRFDIYADLFWKQNGSLVIILQLCRKDFFNGDVGLTNAENVTKLYVDQDFDEIISYKLRLREDELTLSYDGSMLSNISFNTAREELLSDRVSIMALPELFRSQARGDVWVVGSINGVHWDKNWYYIKCSYCSKSFPDTYTKVYCESCRHCVYSSAKYRIYVKVVDGILGATFVLNDDISSILVGSKASSVVEDLFVKSLSRDDVSNEFKDCASFGKPKQILQIIGHTWIFRIPYRGYRLVDGIGQVYTVDKVCGDDDIIEICRNTAIANVGSYIKTECGGDHVSSSSTPPGISRKRLPPQRESQAGVYSPPNKMIAYIDIDD